MLNFRKTIVAITIGLLFSTASFANTSNIKDEVTALTVNVTEVVATSQNISAEDELVRECCGTCTVEVNLLIFSFSYEWCCNWCEEEQEPENIE